MVPEFTLLFVVEHSFGYPFLKMGSVAFTKQFHQLNSEYKHKELVCNYVFNVI